MTRQEAVARLYAAPPDQFVAQRSAIVAELKAAGSADLAKDIRVMRKPTLSAHVLNRFLIERPDAVQDIGDLGEQLRAAQSDLDADLIRSLSAKRSALIERLTDQALATAADQGLRPGPGVQEEVRQSLLAAVVDADAARAVCSGMLTRALSYAGFGSVDLDDATAAELPVRLTSITGGRSQRAGTTVRRSAGSAGSAEEEPDFDGGADEKADSDTGPVRRVRVSGGKRAAAGEAADRNEAERAGAEQRDQRVAELRESAAEAAVELERAEQEYERAVAVRDSAGRDVERLEAELHGAQTSLAASESGARAARARLRNAQSAALTAARRLSKVADH